MAPRIVDVTTADDYTFLDVARPPFDLSDRGVDGRTAPGPLDVFMTSERGIYRPGETAYLTALVRDAFAETVNHYGPDSDHTMLAKLLQDVRKTEL